MALSPNPTGTSVASTPPSDVGLCAACGAKNSLRATRCHKCAEILPWEKARVEKKERSAQTKAAVKSQVASTGVAVGGNVGELLKIGVSNFFVFAFCAAAPFLGYFLWKHLDNEGSDYAGAAFFGWIIGAVLHIGRFGLRFFGTMAQVGES